tara:strand:- start:3812 stop:4786 length:975 start_codon:yes stop_codon:yes gene_type:complete
MKNKKNIVLIGVGEIGSRHLQAISKMRNVSIDVVDPNKISIQNAKTRLVEINNSNGDINFHKSIEFINKSIDLLIIATSSKIRFNITKELISKNSVRNIVFEKVLFQRVDEYFLMQKLLKKHKINAWVNHPRRMFPFYNKLKVELKTSNNILFNYSGYDWGMACNGLHFIDLFSYLTDTNDLKLDNSLIRDEIINSKRDGFSEINGIIHGNLGNSSFVINSNPFKISSTLTIHSEKFIYVIDELNGIVYSRKINNNWKPKSENKRIILFQSELSDVFSSNILNNNICLLPTYEDSMRLHIPFIKCLIEHFNRISSKKTDYCNIT